MLFEKSGEVRDVGKAATVRDLRDGISARQKLVLCVQKAHSVTVFHRWEGEKSQKFSPQMRLTYAAYFGKEGDGYILCIVLVYIITRGFYKAVGGG